jgi:hypothetical protein
MIIELVYLIIGLSKVDISSFYILNFFPSKKDVILGKAACGFYVTGGPIAASSAVATDLM